jgi:hypothetical protein
MAGLDAKRGEADGGMRFRHHFIPLIFFDFRASAAARSLDGTKTVPGKPRR